VSGAGLSTIVTNARIKTADPARPWATALGIHDGRLAVIGNAAEILKMAAPSCEIVDAGGKPVTLPPGLTPGDPVTVTVLHGLVTLRTGLEQS
jgi:predicted amidohydrolase YtcJ